MKYTPFLISPTSIHVDDLDKLGDSIHMAVEALDPPDPDLDTIAQDVLLRYRAAHEGLHALMQDLTARLLQQVRP